MWYLSDLMDNTTPIQIFSSLSTNNNHHSLFVNSSGDIGLANNSVFIDSSKKFLGIGTTAPAADLHVAGSGDIRLTDSYHAWTLSDYGHPTDGYSRFILFDSTNGTFPFSVYEQNPNYTMVLRNGNTGLGTDSPTAKLDVWGDIASTFSGSNTVGDGLTNLLVLSANNTEAGKVSDAGFTLRNDRGGKQWNFRTMNNGTAFAATIEGTGGTEFFVSNNVGNYTNAKMKIGGVTIFENGHLVTSSSRSVKTNIQPLETAAAIDAFHKLQPVRYAYKAHLGDSVVGFIAEDIPELVAMPSRKTLDSTEIVAVLTKVVQEQERMIQEQQTQLHTQKDENIALKTAVDSLNNRLKAIETILYNVAAIPNKTEESVALLKQ